jgi:hypothetical protein
MVNSNLKTNTSQYTIKILRWAGIGLCGIFVVVCGLILTLFITDPCEFDCGDMGRGRLLFVAGLMATIMPAIGGFLLWLSLRMQTDHNIAAVSANERLTRLTASLLQVFGVGVMAVASVTALTLLQSTFNANQIGQPFNPWETAQVLGFVLIFSGIPFICGMVGLLLGRKITMLLKSHKE